MYNYIYAVIHLVYTFSTHTACIMGAKLSSTQQVARKTSCWEQNIMCA